MITFPSNLLALFRDPQHDLDTFVQALCGSRCLRVDFSDVLSIVAADGATDTLFLHKIACLGYACPLLRDAWIGNNLITFLCEVLDSFYTGATCAAEPFVLACAEVLIRQCSDQKQLLRALRMEKRWPELTDSLKFRLQGLRDQPTSADVDRRCDALVSAVIDTDKSLGYFIDELSTKDVAPGNFGALCKLLVHDSSSTAATNLKIQFLAMACRAQRQYIIRWMAPLVASLLGETDTGIKINFHHLQDILNVEFDIDLLDLNLTRLYRVFAECPKHADPMIDKIIQVLEARVEQVSSKALHADGNDKNKVEAVNGDDNSHVTEDDDDGYDDVGYDNDWEEYDGQVLSYSDNVRIGKGLQTDFYSRHTNRREASKGAKSKRKYQSEDNDSDCVPPLSDSRRNNSVSDFPTSDSDSEDSGSAKMRSDSMKQGHKRRRYDRTVELILDNVATAKAAASHRAPTQLRVYLEPHGEKPARLTLKY